MNETGLKEQFVCTMPLSGYCDGVPVKRLNCPALTATDCGEKLCEIAIEKAI